MNRGGSTEAGTPKKEAATPATKSGRKVKRPAHFDDSPDRTRKSEAPAEVAKKSARKTLIKPSQEDTPSKSSNEHAESPEPVAAKKSARKTLLKDEPAKKSARKTKANDDSGKESSPEPESIAQPKSARKALLKSAVKNASVEQDRDAGTPKAKKNNKPESEEETAAGEAGVSRTGRKIKVPAHLKEFEDVVVPIAAVKKEQSEVAPPRKSIAPVATKRDAPEVVAPKTPGRARSVARKATTEEEEERVAPKTPSRRAKSIAREPSEDPLAIEPEYEKPPAKTPKRAKSMAPEAKKSPESKEDNKPPTKTPVKRGRSMAPRADIVNTPEPAAPKTPRASKLAAEDSGEPVSRSGRKIKPKKYFGEFEEEESVAITAPASKVASPVKASPKSSPVVKKDSPVKTVAKASPKVASPVKKIQSPVVTKDSPQASKKDAEPKKSPSPVKRVIAAAAGSASPQKKAKLELKPADPEKESKISPNTEERQITIRGHNDHHHAVETESVETVSDKDPLAGSSAETVITVKSDEQKQSPEPVALKQQVEEKPKQRGGRKTLPAAPSEDETPKAPKTPSRKIIMPTATASAVVEDAAGSSRSGRKIKPKKFFGDDEPEAAPVTKTPAAAANASARGKRKTIVADKKTPSPVPEPEQQPPVVQQPEAVTSREEILAIVGAVGVAAAPEEELLNLDIAESGLPSVLMAEAAQHDDLVSLEGQLESLIGSDHPPSNILAANQNEPAETTEEPQDTPVEDALDLVELLSQPSSQDLSEEPAQQEPASEGNFPGTLIEQTAPAAAATTVETLPTEEPAVAPNDHVPLVENPPVEAPITAADEQVEAEQVVAEEAAPEPEAETTTTVENPTETQPAEVSASSNFSEALRVEEDAAEPPMLAEEEKPDELFESIEFLEDSSTTGEHAAEQANPTEATVPKEEPSITPDIEEDLDKTEPPAMDDLGDEQEAGTPPAANATFTADKDESITVLPSTPKCKTEKDEGVEDLIGKAPTPHSSRTVVAVIEIPDTPLAGKQNLTPATPKTPEAKSSAAAKDDFSPDKPDSQEEASVPQEIIEISDSPIVTLLEPSSSAKTKRESATSTPLKHATPKKLTVQERLIQNSRKRSLSASDADVTKKNVTFHSPANSTILVDTIDERLKKSFKNGGSASKSAQRKRSLSEHKDSLKQDGPKPPKISKLPNFKSIHENHFNRMESIDEYHNRKVQRAKDVLANSTVKSPAASALVKTAERTTPHKASATTTVTKPVVPLLKFGQPPKADSSKLLSDEARQEKRQKQFQAAFKPKSAAATTTAASSSSKDTSDGTRRVVEQSRHKQHQILKGVRTNKRFELLMKFRDAQD